MQKGSKSDQGKCEGGHNTSMSHEDRHLVRIVTRNSYISAPCLSMQSIGYFGWYMTVQTVINRPLAAGYRSQCTLGCLRLTLVHRRRRR